MICPIYVKYMRNKNHRRYIWVFIILLCCLRIQISKVVHPRCV